MRWEVEYTDGFGKWGNDLSDQEQESVDASVRLLEERGPTLGSPTAVGSVDQNMAICANFALNIKAALCGLSMRLIRDERQSCCSEGIRPVTIGGTTQMFPSPTDSTMRTWRNYERRG